MAGYPDVQIRFLGRRCQRTQAVLLRNRNLADQSFQAGPFTTETADRSIVRRGDQSYHDDQRYQRSSGRAFPGMAILSRSRLRSLCRILSLPARSQQICLEVSALAAAVETG